MGYAKQRMNPTVANHVNRNFTVLFTLAVIKAVHRLPPPWQPKKKGRKGNDPKIIAIGCILKVGFNQTYDGIEAHMKDSQTLQATYPVTPGHSVIHRGMNRLSIKYIRKVIHLVTRFLRRRRMTIAVDSTGFSTHQSSTWYDIRIARQGSRRDCIKLHISVDVHTGVVHSFTTTRWNRHDSREFARLIKHLPDLDKVLGDGAYSSRANCQLVADKHGTPYLSFRVDAARRPRGSLAYVVSFQARKRDPEAWLAVYHLRAIVESVFSSMKRRWGSFLQSRRRWMQKRELALKVFAYDVKQVLMVRYARDRKVALWVKA
jgi:transposase